jgi:hypothetical protein
MMIACASHVKHNRLLVQPLTASLRTLREEAMCEEYRERHQESTAAEAIYCGEQAKDRIFQMSCRTAP